jgi:Fic family protein
LVGIIETAKGSIETFDNIMKLQKEVDERIQKLGARTSNARAVVSRLYQRPLTNAQKVSDLTGLSLPSAYKLVEELENIGILKEITGAKRGKQYWFDAYIELFK